ncbi:MAG: alpha/beta fold hydrolase [Pseudomonadota bacterium]
MSKGLMRLPAGLLALFLAGCAGSGETVPRVGPPMVERGFALDTEAMVDAAPLPAATATEFGPAPHQVVMPDGTPLPLRRWGPAPEAGESPEAVILGLHGFNDHAGAFAATATALAPDDIAVYAWDQRGFGASRQRGHWVGTDRLVADALWIADELRQRYPETPIYMMGLSMGGAVTALAVERDPDLPVDGALLVGPAFWGRATMPWYQRVALWVGERVAPWMSFTGDGLGIEPTDDPAVARQLARDPLWIRDTRVDAIAGISDLMDRGLLALPKLRGPPTLIQYGGADEIIPADAACAMFRRLPVDGNWRAAYYPEGYHMLTRYTGAPAVLNDIRAFITDTGGKLPSGRAIDRAAAIAELCDE